MLKKLNIILKKQSHMKIMTANSFRYLIKRILVIVFTFGGLRALYASITGRYSICLTKKIFQLYTVIIGRNLSCRSNFWETLTILIHKHSTIYMNPHCCNSLTFCTSSREKWYFPAKKKGMSSITPKGSNYIFIVSPLSLLVYV